MSEKLTRRRLAVALTASGALSAAFAGQSSKPGEAKPPEDLLGNAREQVARSAEQLSKYQVPVSVEPAFAFRP